MMPHTSRRRSSTGHGTGDRKSTRLNSSHLVISYAVFCLKKKKNTAQSQPMTHLSRTTPLSFPFLFTLALPPSRVRARPHTSTSPDQSVENRRCRHAPYHH